jgi:hypothetical protein
VHEQITKCLKVFIPHVMTGFSKQCTMHQRQPKPWALRTSRLCGVRMHLCGAFCMYCFVLVLAISLNASPKPSSGQKRTTMFLTKHNVCYHVPVIRCQSASDVCAILLQALSVNGEGRVVLA